MSQPNRLGADVPAEFGAPLIDRGRPIRLAVNGVWLDAYQGDTVLSALLANGIVSAGTQSGHDVALDADSAPPVAAEGSYAQMPMVLCPAVDGARFSTVGPKRKSAPVKRLLMGHRRSLEHDFDSQHAPGAWIDAAPGETLETDFVIIGGGVAGMSAALAAAQTRSRVILIEREPVLGGIAVMFGKAEGETPPEELVATLSARIGSEDRITVLTSTEAFDLHDGMLRAVQVIVRNGQPQPRHLAIRHTHAVLATGTGERLPVFPGNRLPGVMGAVFLWRMARQYGVWPGRSFHLHTATNAGYRLAMLGSEAGRTVNRASDPRLDPRTRFIEFCKAYGFRLGWGARIAQIVPDRSSLTVTLADDQFGNVQNDPVRADALIVSGGWQPAAALWLLAGGEVAWDAQRQQLLPTGAARGVMLAGSVAGFSGTTACIESGKASIAERLNGERRAISDPQIEEIYESRDGPITVSAPAARGLPPAWLAASRRMAVPEPARRGLKALLLRQAQERSDEVRNADLASVAGAVAAGILPEQEASAYCRQWCVVPRQFAAGALPEMHPPATTPLPQYLAGRFGIGQALWDLSLQFERAFEPGCLIFINTDDTHPRSAIGTVVSTDTKACVALMARTEFAEGDIVYIRDGTSCTAARLRRRH